jgi:hypothetical protein
VTRAALPEPVMFLYVEQPPDRQLVFTIRTGSSVTIVPTSEHCFSVTTTKKPAGQDPLGDKATSPRAIEIAGANGSAKKGIRKSPREKREQQRDVLNAIAENAAKLRNSRRSIAGAGRNPARRRRRIENGEKVFGFLFVLGFPPEKTNSKIDYENHFWKSFGNHLEIMPRVLVLFSTCCSYVARLFCFVLARVRTGHCGT